MSYLFLIILKIQIAFSLDEDEGIEIKKIQDIAQDTILVNLNSQKYKVHEIIINFPDKDTFKSLTKSSPSQIEYFSLEFLLKHLQLIKLVFKRSSDSSVSQHIQQCMGQFQYNHQIRVPKHCLIRNEMELDAWKVEAQKIFSPLDKAVGIPHLIDEDLKDWKGYKDYSRFQSETSPLVPNMHQLDAAHLPTGRKSDFLLPFYNDSVNVDILAVYDETREYSFEDTEAQEYLMAMDQHEVLPVADIEFPDIGDQLMVACQANSNNWFDSISDFYHWFHKGNKSRTKAIQALMAKLGLTMESLYLEGNMHKLYDAFKQEWGDGSFNFDTLISVGRVTGQSNKHFTFDANLLPNCEGSLVINITQNGFHQPKGEQRPKSMKQMGVVVAGNPTLNSNVGQFNFDYNNHVFNSSVEEFNHVSDKISTFNEVLKQQKIQQIKTQNSNSILDYIQQFLEFIQDKILWILVILIFIIIFIVLSQKRKDQDKQL